MRWQTLRDKGLAKMTDAERAEWLGGMKGAYNVTDLNRVGTALNYVRDRILVAGYSVSFSAKTDWTASDVPTLAQFQYYIDCVRQVRGAVSRFHNTPPVPAYSGALDYLEANNIEKILIDIDTILNNLAAALFYANDLYSGEV
jgi:hypothetical protein